MERQAALAALAAPVAKPKPHPSTQSVKGWGKQSYAAADGYATAFLFGADAWPLAAGFARNCTSA